VCIGGKKESVRRACASVKRAGHRPIAITTDVHPDCTLSLLASLSPEVTVILDDLPHTDGKTFSDSLKYLCPDVRVLLMPKKQDFAKLFSELLETCAAANDDKRARKLAKLLKINAA
jgi:hypothetical protein